MCCSSDTVTILNKAGVVQDDTSSLFNNLRGTQSYFSLLIRTRKQKSLLSLHMLSPRAGYLVPHTVIGWFISRPCQFLSKSLRTWCGLCNPCNTPPPLPPPPPPPPQPPPPLPPPPSHTPHVSSFHLCHSIGEAS